MAAITPVPTNLANEPGCKQVLWETLTESDTATAIEMGAFPDRSVQVVGTFGGATVVLQGSNDGTNWVTLNDYQGNAISLTATGLKPIAEVTRYIRPSASGGTGQDVDVYVFQRGDHQKVR
jgi:hypothetical protein